MSPVQAKIQSNKVYKVTLSSGSYSTLASLVNVYGLQYYSGYLYVGSLANHTIYKVNVSDGTNTAWNTSVYYPIGLGIYNGYLYSCNYVQSTAIYQINLSDGSVANSSFYTLNYAGGYGAMVYNGYYYVYNTSGSSQYITRIACQ